MEATYAGIPLTGPTPSEHSGPVNIPWAVAVQTVALVRSERMYAGGLGNRLAGVEFSAVRRFGSTLDAMLARATFFAELPGEGELVLSQLDAGRMLTLTAQAVLGSAPAPELMGRACRFTWVFHVRDFAAVVATPGSLLTEEGAGLLSEEDAPIIIET